MDAWKGQLEIGFQPATVSIHRQLLNGMNPADEYILTWGSPSDHRFLTRSHTSYIVISYHIVIPYSTYFLCINLNMCYIFISCIISFVHIDFCDLQLLQVVESQSSANSRVTVEFQQQGHSCDLAKCLAGFFELSHAIFK